MVLAREAEYFSASEAGRHIVHDERGGGGLQSRTSGREANIMAEEEDLDAYRPPYLHVSVRRGQQK